MTTILDGKAVAKKWRAATKTRVEQLLASRHIVPTLAVVLVGEDPASQIYVRNKIKMAQRVGIRSINQTLPATATQAEVLAVVAELNADPEVDGILVQLPLPDQISEETVLLAVDPHKDVDGFHPFNLGKLWSGQPELVPATAAGIMHLLAEYQLDVDGKNVLIIGRSLIVGRPLAGLFLAANATVTIAHSHTQNIQTLAQQADIIVAAIGQANFVTADLVKPGAVVIDVGTNRINGHLVGDVDYELVAEKADFITPVPGGVGPMTIAALLSQTTDLAEKR
ncbi:bifunctional methylenetetrahydrofolate dehydrogenase/methenyltetrahydrofolate cyclohydrolase FolD [Lapidilactobacillus bayanensis]|uniref:bifunctional methylenetetrahydrofolate dehydrogenase/methenyltetrahydrofolate cyclohydrolase FolD n=1 Tax=Lapidilactobacillus bayanensis TaxID=2485998 RepID=UPI000F77F4AE|nr:bifunctional methylenetetrahydrofolate dehydrogenase/methenyltetrahydrofolate cyclohydrolase FolD [Lapidilactobacillus bayanensis]